MKLLLLFSSVILVLILIIQVDSKQVLVTIPNGQIVGQTVESTYGQQVNQFLGIPYARPPVGKLRFRRPVPADRWNEPIKALEWPNNCFQLSEKGKKKDIQFMNDNFSEDCLYLNVWSPNVTVDRNHLMPVFVFIHGGGFSQGGTSFDLYNGNVLSGMGDLVVVTMNYRVSTFGFLYSDAVDDIKGNQGLWDQALALEWVNKNIQHFGGDPKKITLSGNSAGSKSVSAHILSPISRNLFQNAIMFSGAALPIIISKPRALTEAFLFGIRKVGCASEDDTSITKSVIECLEGLDEKTVGKIPFFDKTIYYYPSFLVVDGQFFPEHPVDMLANGNHKVNFNLIASTVEDEGSFVLDLHGRDARFRRFNPEPISLEEAKNFLIDVMSSKVLKKPVINNGTITKFYFAGFNGNYDHQDMFRKQIGIALGDFLLACPTIVFANRVFKSSPDSVNVYLMHYTAKFGKEKFLCSEWMGTCHCNEIYSVFGMPFRYPDQYHYREHEISYQIIAMISSFARTGNPDSLHSQWQNYYLSQDGKSFAAPYYELSNKVVSHKSYKYNLKQFECETIWNQYILQKD